MHTLAVLIKRAKVTGDAHGIRNGWFFWPINFDPGWLQSCTGFKAKNKAKKPTKEN